MKSNTFILIVSAYSFLLGIPSLFMPSFSLEYFAGEPNNLQQQSLINFIGGYQIALGFVGLMIHKANEPIARRALLLAFAFLTVLAIILQFYNLNIRQIPVGSTYLIDISVWAIIAISAIYFWAKEK